MPRSTNTDLSARSAFRGAFPFGLEKWFLDMVTETGEALIVYAARMRWGRIPLPYTSLIHHLPGKGSAHQTRWRKIHMPLEEGDRLTWKDDKFGLDGTWQAVSSPLFARLIEEPDGHLDWRAVKPRAKVTLLWKGRKLEGLGYAERLVLNLEPWKMNLRELKWGRFLTESDVLVWIDLKRDGKEQQWVWYQGERIHNARIGNESVFLPEQQIRLSLDLGTVLEAEKKFAQVVQKIRKLVPLFPRSFPTSFLQTDEKKWLSKGQLFKNGNLIREGWAIHEQLTTAP